MVRGTLERMKLWNGYQWVDYDGEPQSGSVLAARDIADTDGGLDPAVKVITNEGSISAVEAMHQRFAQHQDDDTDEFVRPSRTLLDARVRAGDREGDVVVVPNADAFDKRAGELPAPRATFQFDTSEEG